MTAAMGDHGHGTDDGSLQVGDAMFTAVPDEPRTWSYRVTRISLSSNADGRSRQLSIVEAGAFAMVALTTELSLPAANADAARRVLADREGCTAADIMLIPAELAVTSAAVLLGDGTATCERLATAETSGYHPYTAVFSATLDSSALAKVKSGLSGQRGWFAAEYRFAERLRPTSRGSTSEVRVSEQSTVTTEPGGTSHTTTRRTSTRSSTSEPGGGVAPSTEVRILTDAAEWDLGSR